MKVKIVKRYRTPKYPDREIYALHPELLACRVPSGWLKSQAAMGALMAFILGGTKIIIAASQGTNAPQAISPVNTKEEQQTQARETEIKIAPLFIHGDGRGSTGCVAVSAPAFLSEAEAIEVITNELKKENIAFDKQDIVMPNFYIEQKETDHYSLKPVTKTIKHSFVFDGFNTLYNLGFKFVCQANYFKLGGSHSGETVQDWDFVNVAYQLKEKIKDYHRVNAAFFYDPAIYIEWRDLSGPCHTAEDCKEYAKDLLKDQVHDFIAWMRTEIIRRNK